MSVPASLLPELEEVVQHGSAEKRAETLRRITSLFLDGAGELQRRTRRAVRRRHRLPDRGNRGQGAGGTGAPARAGAERAAGVVRTLAKNDDIAVAGPVLKQARIDDPDLKQIAETKSQAHLVGAVHPHRDQRGRCRTCWCSAATARWRAASPPIRRRGCRRMRSPRWSSAPSATACWPRRSACAADIPPRLFRQLLMQASEVVQKRLLAQAKPETQAEIRRVLAKVTAAVAAKVAPRDYTRALPRVQATNKEHKLTEADIAAICQDRQVRGDHRRDCHHLLGAGRGGGPADQRRARRSGADPGARGRLRLADGARDHQRAARRQTLGARHSMPRRRISNG